MANKSIGLRASSFFFALGIGIGETLLRIGRRNDGFVDWEIGVYIGIGLLSFCTSSAIACVFIFWD